MPEHSSEFYDLTNNGWLRRPSYTDDFLKANLRPVEIENLHTGIPVSHGPHLTKEQGKQLERLNEKGAGK